MSDREPTTMDDLSSSTVSSVGSGYAGIQNGSRRLPKVFDFHSGRKCPTCGGTGKIPKGQDEELVALIPYSDKRLRPKKPWLLILLICLITFIVITLIAGVILAVLMYPREVSINVLNITESHSYLTFRKDGNSNVTNVTLEFLTSMAIGNSNYFPIELEYVTMEINYLEVIVSNYTHQQLLFVTSKSNKEVPFIQNATFSGVHSKRLLFLCTDPNYKSMIHIDLSVTASYTYLSHKTSVMSTLSSYFACRIQIPIHNGTMHTPPYL